MTEEKKKHTVHEAVVLTPGKEMLTDPMKAPGETVGVLKIVEVEDGLIAGMYFNTGIMMALTDYGRSMIVDALRTHADYIENGQVEATIAATLSQQHKGHQG